MAPFTDVLTQVVVVVALLLPISVALFVGRQRLVATRQEWRSRLRVEAPVIAVLLAVLGFNRVMRWGGPAISQEIGIHMTSTFYRIEGEFILVFQRIASSEMTTYFSLIYVYGYTFLLVFPIVAYFALSDTRPFRRLLTAYSFNYLIGVVLYILIIAYGPRNMMPELLVETNLYDNSPEYQHLTRQVNRNHNVFPSLHTSLAATVAIFAFRTREQYRAWFPIAVLLAISVVISTMYLGIHWAIDVVAGLLLAGVAVWIADRLVARSALIRTTVARQFDRLRGDR